MGSNTIALTASNATNWRPMLHKVYSVLALSNSRVWEIWGNQRYVTLFHHSGLSKLSELGPRHLFIYVLLSWPPPKDLATSRNFESLGNSLQAARSRALNLSNPYASCSLDGPFALTFLVLIFPQTVSVETETAAYKNGCTWRQETRTTTK